MKKIATSAAALALTAGVALTVATPADAHSVSATSARRWLTTVSADGQHSLYGIVRTRHPRYTTRQVGYEASATRNRFYPGRSIYRVFPRGTQVTVYS